MKSYKLRERIHDELLYDLLAARGIEREESIAQFLAPNFERDSHDPTLLPDMEKAVERILFAKRNNEKVCVWSDYDCDGVPGGVMLAQFLRTIGLNVRHYIPHRHKEGYGMNNEGIDSLAEDGITLVITIDLGTTEHEPIAYANAKGMDVIVTDHHLVHEDEALPRAFALINPKRPDSNYPFDGLCGAGVAWKLVQGILAKDRAGFPEAQEKWFLDLVGLATLSDMVPLIGENRMLAHFGLTVMKRNRRPGFAALFKLLKIRANALTEDDIGFMISPRINAASRMDTPELAARLLGSESEEEAGALAKQLNHINDERKGLVAATVKEANKRLAEQPHSPVIVLGSINWRPGILGLVANKLAEAHGKPVFLWGREGGELLRGSVRSGDGVSVVDIMSGARDVFDHFGGHKASGGFAVTEERVHELVPKLSQSYETLRLKGVDETPTMLEREMSLAEVPHAMRDLSRLAPFGEGNRKPLFLFPRAELSAIRMFGKNQDHITVSLTQNGYSASGVSFFFSPESFSKQIEVGNTADIIGHIEPDWQGKPRIRIIDIL